ncbi:MAG: hypothetical protein ACFFEV_06430 [Candidatus Thorarchaeota archaeon]
MTDEKDSTEMAEDLVDAIDDEADSDDVGDGLTKRERSIEVSRVAERERKAEELRKQLRKRSLGMLNYRWATGTLIIGGIIAIITNFVQVMTRGPSVPSDVGFNTFLDAFFLTGGAIYVFPLIAGAFMIILSYFAYTTPKYTWLALIPGIMLAMSGFVVYFLITFAVTAQPELTEDLYATFGPILMIIAAATNLIAIFLKEKE